MTPEDIDLMTNRLKQLGLDQLELFQQRLIVKIEEKRVAKLAAEQEKEQARLTELAAKKERKPHFPPANYNDLNSLADMQGLDLSGLMKEISRK